MNALKSVENNPIFMFNSQRDIPWLVHSLTPFNAFKRITKKTFLQFLQVNFFAFSSSLKTRAFSISYFLWNHSLQAAQVAMDRPLSTSGSELEKGIQQWQYNWMWCVIYLPRLVIWLEFGYGSKSPLIRHHNKCFLISCRS